MHLLSRSPVSSQCAALLSCDALPSPTLPALTWLLSQCLSPTSSRKPSLGPLHTPLAPFVCPCRCAHDRKEKFT